MATPNANSFRCYLARHRLALVIALLVITLTAIWMSLDWIWSTIDDPGFVLSFQDLDAKHGFLGARALQAYQMFTSDLNWGLFRPSYWLYPSAIYGLPVSVVHGIRLLMLLAALAGPIIALRRMGRSTITLIMAGLIIVAAGSQLSNGLFFLSLQELSGAAFIGLGLMTKRPWLRIILWTFAAWFKSPFSWLLIAEAIVLWRSGRRGYAIASMSIGIGTLTTAALFARHGSYTEKYGLDLWRILTNASKLVEVWTALVLLMVLWWLAATKTTLNLNSQAFVFGFGFVGYTTQMLPWSVTGYYMGPIIFLFGVFLVSMLTNPVPMPWWRSALALSGPLIIGIYVFRQPIAQGLETNQALIDINECIVRESPVNAVIAGHMDYLTTTEGVVRIQQNAVLTDPSWTGSVELQNPENPDALPPGVNTFVAIGNAQVPKGPGFESVCQQGSISVYRFSTP